jgi:hypothetical protein
MSERDYILATNVVRVRMMLNLLRDMTPCKEMPRKQVMAMSKLAGQWEEQLSNAINERMYQ